MKDAIKQCPDFESLVRYTDNELTDREKTSMKQHLAQCPDCNAKVASIREVQSSLVLHYRNMAVEETPACLSDEDISAYADGEVSEREKETCEEHLSVCLWCIKRLVDVKEAIQVYEKGEFSEPDEALVEKMRNLKLGAGGAGGKVFSVAGKKTEGDGVIECKLCNAKNPPQSMFCRVCGEKLSLLFIACIHYGKDVMEGSKFCNFCGKKLVMEESETKKKQWEAIMEWIPEPLQKNKWLVGAIAAFAGSFAFPAIFIQFLLVSGVSAGLWIFEKNNRDMLREIYKLWKEEGEPKARAKVLELKKKITGK